MYNGDYMSDQYYIDKANTLLEAGFYTRTSLARTLGISPEKLSKLSADIPKYPRALTTSQAARLGVKTGKIKWGHDFYLKGSPIYAKR